MFKALIYAYVLGGLTFIPLVIAVAIFITVYTSVPVGEVDMAKERRGKLEATSIGEEKEDQATEAHTDSAPLDTNDRPTTRKGWLTMRRTFEETENDTSYVTLVRSFLDARSKDPKRSRPKDMWYVVLKRNILYLYEDEEMSECEVAIQLSGHEVIVYPEGLQDGELYAKRNGICLRRRIQDPSGLPTKEMKPQGEDIEGKLEKTNSPGRRKTEERESSVEAEKKKAAARDEGFDPSTHWFIFVRSNVEMEDWYFALLHASTHPAQTPTLLPLRDVFRPEDMNHLVSTLDDQPDVIPMRWLNALLGRIFFSHYRTHHLEAYIVGRLMKKLEKVKRPQFLTSIAVTEVSVGSRPPMLSKPMLKELTKEGDASLEVHFQYKGEIRITVEATAVINLGARFKSYTVKLVLAVVLKELEGNLLVKVKRPPSNRIWYAFTQTPRMVLEVEPIVSDRQITWGMILSTIESKIKEIIQESVVMPNMDDIAFFDTLPYENRGGIWAEASRHSHPKPFITPEMADDAFSTASAPLPDTSGTPTSEPPFVQTSYSEETLSAKASTPSQSTETPPKVIVDDPSDSVRNNSRRKNWFSSVRSDDGNSLSPDVFSQDSEDCASNSSRGRAEQTGNNSEDGRSASRSRSRPRSVRSIRSQKSNYGGSNSDAGTSRRSSSRLSHRGIEDDDSEHDEDLDDMPRSKSSPATPRRISDASQNQRSPSPPSFFSTLKSKAGDKQALSNTAKEAMRKWGVNWGLKKGSNTGASGNEDPQDATSSFSRSNAGTNASQMHKPRASYAEVRAAVAERKEREKLSDHDLNRPSSPPSPNGSQSPGNVTTGQSSTLLNASGYSENPINPSIVSAAARLATPRLASKKSSPSISRVNTDIDAEELAAPDTPIHVQPQAKSMTIPGIHVKHRGEIQSMGYMAEQPPPIAPSTTLESRLKNPAIQTVYRFWKSPGVSNQDHDSSSQNDNQEQTGEAQSESDITQSMSNAQVALPSQDIMRPTPPPLPARSVPIPVSKAKASTSPIPSPSSPASSALKDIVTKDENIRNLTAQEQPDSQSATAPTNEGRGSDSLVPIGGALNSNANATESATLSSRTPPPLPPRRATALA